MERECIGLWTQAQLWGCSHRTPHYLCEVKLQLPAMELTLVELDPCSRCSLGLAEIDPHSAKALEQLECDLVIVEGEQGLKPLLHGEQQGQGKREGRQNSPINGDRLRGSGSCGSSFLTGVQSC